MILQYFAIRFTLKYEDRKIKLLKIGFQTRDLQINNWPFNNCAIPLAINIAKDRTSNITCTCIWYFIVYFERKYFTL